MTRRLRIPLIASLLALAACTVGPDHVPPATPGAAAGPFIGADDPAFVPSEPEPDWWRLYSDPVLDGLIEDAFARNTDLRVAAANLARARALLRESRSARLPQTGIGASALYGRVPEDETSPGGDRQDWRFDAGLDVAWEVDLFGRVSRAIEAGRADAAAAAAARDAVRIAVAAETARAYADGAAAAERLAVAERSLALIERTLFITTRRLEAGRDTRLDVARVASLRDQQRATLPPLRAERDGALFRLAALTGRGPPARPPPRAGGPPSRSRSATAGRFSPGGPTYARPSDGSPRRRRGSGSPRPISIRASPWADRSAPPGRRSATCLPAGRCAGCSGRSSTGPSPTRKRCGRGSRRPKRRPRRPSPASTGPC